MSYPIAAIRAALLEWLKTESGQDVIWQYQNRPRPGEPFISVNATANIRRIGMRDSKTYVESGKYAVIGTRETLASIQAHGPDAVLTLNNCLDALEIDSKYQAYFGARLLACRTERVQDLTELKNGQYTGRAQLDVIITSSHQQIETVETAIGAAVMVCVSPDELPINIDGEDD